MGIGLCSYIMGPIVISLDPGCINLKAKWMETFEADDAIYQETDAESFRMRLQATKSAARCALRQYHQQRN